MMQEHPYTLNSDRQAIVLEAIRSACEANGLTLHAAHVRFRHVHVVVGAALGPERVLGLLKGRASFELRVIDPATRKRWSRHGSTKYLWTQQQLGRAIDYVINGQGASMAVYSRIGPF